MNNKGIAVKRETFEWQYCETCFYSCRCLPLEYNRFRHIEHVLGLHITLVFIQNCIFSPIKLVSCYRSFLSTFDIQIHCIYGLLSVPETR